MLVVFLFLFFQKIILKINIFSIKYSLKYRLVTRGQRIVFPPGLPPRNKSNNHSLPAPSILTILGINLPRISTNSVWFCITVSMSL